MDRTLATATPPVSASDPLTELGELADRQGWPRLVGRVMALLLIADPPYLSSADLCARLPASKSHLSSAITLLDSMGMIQRFGMPGTRRDHYRLSPRAFDVAFRRSVEPLMQMADIAERARATVAAGSPAEAQLSRMRDLYTFLAERYPALIDEFDELEANR